MANNYNILDTPVGALPFSGVRVSLNGDQAIANNAQSEVAWGNTDYDTGGYWSAGLPERLTIPAAVGTAKYILAGCIVFDNSIVGIREIMFSKNGSTFGGNPLFIGPASTALGNGIPFCSTPIIFDAGDVIKLIVYQNSGGNLNIIAGGGNTRWGLYRFSA